MPTVYTDVKGRKIISNQVRCAPPNTCCCSLKLYFFQSGTLSFLTFHCECCICGSHVDVQALSRLCNRFLVELGRAPEYQRVQVVVS